MTERRLIFTFRGTPSDLLDYLDDIVRRSAPPPPGLEREIYEWELTAAISRHPAGKGLGR